MSTLRTVVLLFLFAGMAVAQESLPGFLNRPKIEDKLLPKATISKAAGELSFINTTPGFEAIAWRLGSGELKFTKMDKGDIILRHNGKSVRMDASHGIEMGKPAHYEYVKAADDRLGARIHALSQFLVKTDEAVIKGLIDDLLLAEYRKLRALAQRPDAIHAHRDLDLLLFRWMEGPEAYLPTKHNGMLLNEVLKKGAMVRHAGQGSIHAQRTPRPRVPRLPHQGPDRPRRRRKHRHQTQPATTGVGDEVGELLPTKVNVIRLGKKNLHLNISFVRHYSQIEMQYKPQGTHVPRSPDSG